MKQGATVVIHRDDWKRFTRRSRRDIKKIMKEKEGRLLLVRRDTPKGQAVFMRGENDGSGDGQGQS